MAKILFLIGIPLISGFIGWLTNYFAIKMLFHPKEPVNLIFFKLQGIFPKRQEALAERLGEVISQEILSTEDIVKHFSNNSSLNEDLRKVTEDYLDDFIQNRLLGKIPMAKMFISDALVDGLKQSFFEDWDKVMDSIKETLSERLRKDVSIKELIQEKVVGFSSGKLEEILFAILKKEFRFIEIVGAVLGLIIGCVQLVFAWLYNMI